MGCAAAPKAPPHTPQITQTLPTKEVQKDKPVQSFDKGRKSAT